MTQRVVRSIRVRRPHDEVADLRHRPAPGAAGRPGLRALRVRRRSGRDEARGVGRLPRDRHAARRRPGRGHPTLAVPPRVAVRPGHAGTASTSSSSPTDDPDAALVRWSWSTPSPGCSWRRVSELAGQGHRGAAPRGRSRGDPAPPRARRRAAGLSYSGTDSDLRATWLAARWKDSTIASSVSVRRLASVRSQLVGLVRRQAGVLVPREHPAAQDPGELVGELRHVLVDGLVRLGDRLDRHVHLAQLRPRGRSSGSTW